LSHVNFRAEVPEIDFSNTSYPDFYPDPQETVNIGPNDNNINQDVPQQNDTTEEESSKADQSINTLSGAENQSGLEPEEEPLLIPDCNPDESHETILWKRIMAEKKQRQEEYQIIQRERQMLEGERRQIMQLKTNMEQQQKDLQTREQKLIEHDHRLGSYRGVN
jgi:hypothetical protein